MTPLEERIHTLALLRPMCLRWGWDFLWARGSEQKRALRGFGEDLGGITLVANSIGLQVSAEEIFAARPSLVGGLTTVLMNKCVREHAFPLAVRAAFGPSVALRFLLVEITAILALSSRFMETALGPGSPRKRQPHWLEELKQSLELREGFGGAIARRRSDFERLFGRENAARFSQLSRCLPSRGARRDHQIIGDRCNALLERLIPHARGIEERRERAQELWDELKACPAGKKTWRRYEDICARIIRFLFVPPFRAVTVQARTTDRSERRDAMISSNTDWTGFWGAVRDEFSMRHIACEFKNTAHAGTKTDLNQLRIYLSKRTVGRFGLLFVRQPAGASLRKAQRDAYEQSGILVLVLDDKLVERMLLAKAFLGGAEEVLEQEKITFEVSF
jgi:hypothetical protein